MSPWISGPVAALALGLAAGPAGAADGQALACFGTEPFWSLEIDGRDMVFETMAGTGRQLFSAPPRTTSNRTDQRIYRAIDVESGEPATLVLIEGDGCSDGMSDRIHRYDLIVVFPGEALSGCCNPAQ